MKLIININHVNTIISQMDIKCQKVVNTMNKGCTKDGKEQKQHPTNVRRKNIEFEKERDEITRKEGKKCFI